MSKPRLLDAYCGAGGCARGYTNAGFEIVGVDIKPQPRYLLSGAVEFHKGDALEFIREHGHEFDVIHASPPCQKYSQAALGQRNAGKEYPDLLGPTRNALEESGLPWVIENVPGAPLRADFNLCGCHFDLDIRRVRWFETNWSEFQLMRPHYHPYPVVSVVGHGTPTWVRERLGFNPTIKHYRTAMGIDWMNRDQLSQAVPPPYCEHIGRQLIAYLERRDSVAA